MNFTLVKTISKLLVFYVACFFTVSWATPFLGDKACPFTTSANTTCACELVQGNIINTVQCHVAGLDTLPKFDSQPGQYLVDGIFYLVLGGPNSYHIDAGSFLDFTSIYQFTLNATGVPRITWDEGALNGVQIFMFTSVDVNPISSAIEALKSEQADNLLGLGFGNDEKAGVPYELGPHGLSGFHNLQGFQIQGAAIHVVDPNAFSGVEDTLARLYLLDTNVSEVVLPAISSLQKLTDLDLRGTTFESMDLSVLCSLNDLTLLEMDSSEQMKNLSISALDKVPPKLNYVTAVGTGLESIWSSMSGLLDRPGFHTLDISSNTNIICDDNVHWMAKYALCDPFPMLNIDHSYCSNFQKKLLETYLKENVPNPCKQ